MNIKKELKKLGEDYNYNEVEIVDSDKRKNYKILVRNFKNLVTLNEEALNELKWLLNDFNPNIYTQIDIDSSKLLIDDTSRSGNYPGLLATIDMELKTISIILNTELPCNKIIEWCKEFKFSIIKDYDIYKEVYSLFPHFPYLY